MTSRSTWKQRERQSAALFGSVRNPLSCGHGGVTRSDSRHERLFLETKLRVKHTVVTLYDETAKLAKLEGKIPVVALAEKNRPGLWLLIKAEDMQSVANEMNPMGPSLASRD